MDETLQAQLELVQRHADDARSHRDTDGLRACHAARLTVEGMLRLLAAAHDVELQAKGDKPPTIDTMKRNLRHAGVLERKAEDLVSTVQRYGNRAAHFQPRQTQEIDTREGAIAVDAMDAFLPLARLRLGASETDAMEPTPPSEPSSPRFSGLLGAIGFTALAALLAVGTFFGALALLSWTTPPRGPSEPAVTPNMPHVNQFIEEDLAAHREDVTLQPDQPAEPIEPAMGHDTDPVVDTDAANPRVNDAFQQAAASVRLHQPLHNATLAQLDCEQLTRTRSWLWASYGYRVADADLYAWLADQEGYRPSSLASAAITRAFTTHDRTNLDTLNERMRAMECTCPRRMAPKRPCPE